MTGPPPMNPFLAGAILSSSSSNESSIVSASFPVARRTSAFCSGVKVMRVPPLECP